MLGASGLPLIRTSTVMAFTGLPADVVTTALETLVDVHLLQSPTAHRYQLHDLLRIYAAELADKTEDREEDWVHTHQIGVASARRIGDDAITSWLLNGLGQVHGRMGHFAEARASLLEALWIRQRIGDRAGTAAVLNSLGLLHADHGDPEEGLNYLGLRDSRLRW
jgi:hypothetical protein